jgi:hypothetical protein
VAHKHAGTYEWEENTVAVEAAAFNTNQVNSHKILRSHIPYIFLIAGHSCKSND